MDGQEVEQIAVFRPQALKREGHVAAWKDRMLEAGIEWEPEFLEQLGNA